MAMITFRFTRDGEVITRRQGATRHPEKMGWQIGSDRNPGFVPDRMVIDVVRHNTMRRHCFYCWNDADFFHEVEVCADHAPDGAPELMAKYAPGPWDDHD